MQATHNVSARVTALPSGFATGLRSPKGVSRWYAARVPEGRESATAERLRAILPTELLQDAFQITKERWFKRDGNWSLQAKPLFPGWLIVQTADPRALAQEFSRLSFPVELSSGDGRTYLPMSKEAQAFYATHMDASRCLRNSVGVLDQGRLHVIEGLLAGGESSVKKFDRHRRFCLVEGGGARSPFIESMPLDIPEAI